MGGVEKAFLVVGKTAPGQIQYRCYIESEFSEVMN
jgi:hypothetical protein